MKFPTNVALSIFFTQLTLVPACTVQLMVFSYVFSILMIRNNFSTIRMFSWFLLLHIILNLIIENIPKSSQYCLFSHHRYSCMKNFIKWTENFGRKFILYETGLRFVQQKKSFIKNKCKFSVVSEKFSFWSLNFFCWNNLAWRI